MYSHFLKKEFIKNSFQLKKNINSLFSFAISHYRRTRYSCIIKRNAIFDNSSINKRSQFPETVSIIIGAKNSNRIRNPPPLPPLYIGIYLVLICTRKAWLSNFYTKLNRLNSAACQNFHFREIKNIISRLEIKAEIVIC